MEFKGKIMLHYSSGVKWQQGFTTGINELVWIIMVTWLT